MYTYYLKLAHEIYINIEKRKKKFNINAVNIELFSFLSMTVAQISNFNQILFSLNPMTTISVDKMLFLFTFLAVALVNESKNTILYIYKKKKK